MLLTLATSLLAINWIMTCIRMQLLPPTLFVVFV